MPVSSRHELALSMARPSPIRSAREAQSHTPDMGKRHLRGGRGANRGGRVRGRVKVQDDDMTIEPTQIRYSWVDYGRLTAALGVVLFHYCSNGVGRGDVGPIDRFSLVSTVTDYGYLGVNFFFIISGFVIFFSALGRSAGDFAASRVARLYPSFLVCMSLTAIVLALSAGDLTVYRYLANLTFFPRQLGHDFVDDVYWTLNVEIVFYGLIFLAIVLQLTRHPRALVLVTSAVAALSIAAGIHLPVFGGYAPLFTAGMSLALLYRGDAWAWLGLAFSSAAAVYATYDVAKARVGEFPQLLPEVSAMVVAAALFLFVLMRGRDVQNRFVAKSVGSLTYPLYLLHAVIGYAILAPLQNEGNKWAITSAVVVAMLVLSWVVALTVEGKPIWRRLAIQWIARPIDAVIGGAIATLKPVAAR